MRNGAMPRLGSWRRYLDPRGVIGAIRTFIDRCVYRSYRCVITYSPAGGPPAVDHVADVKFRLATRSDLDRLDELDRYGRGAIHRQYVKRDDDWLVVACDGDRIVATRRASRVIRDSVISRVIKLGPDQFWARTYSACLSIATGASAVISKFSGIATSRPLGA
jgi:hypothetical protein